jgi:hypothetical protein
MLHRKKNSIEFHKNKNKEDNIFETKKSNWTNRIYERNLFFHTVTLQQEEELYVEKKMITLRQNLNLFFL